MSSNKKILLIEDDIFVKDLYEKVFKKHGYKVMVAIDGNEGVKIANSTKVDLILLDILLPFKNGIDVLKDLRKKDSPAKGTPIYLLTNLGQESIIKEAFKIGADGYILKSKLLPNEIVAEIEAYFRGERKKEDYMQGFAVG